MTYWRLLRRMASYHFGFYLLSGLLASVLGYVFPLVPGLIVRDLLDALTGSAPARLDVTTLLALLAGFGLVRLAAGIATAAVENGVQLAASALMRKNLLERILQRPGAQALPSSPGEAISRFRDDIRQVVWFLTWTLDPVGQAVVMAFALVVLIQIDPLVTLVVFVPLAGVLLVTNMANRRIRRYRRAAQEALGEVTGLLGEVFGAALAVKVAGAERAVVAHFAGLSDTRRRATLADVVFTRLLETAQHGTANLGTGVLLLIIASSMRSGQLTVGDFALIVSYLAWLTQVASASGQFLTLYRQMQVSLDRLLELLQGAPPDALVRHGPIYLRGPLPEAPTPYATEEAVDHLEAFEARGLGFRYAGSTRGVRDVDLRIGRGEMVVVTGRIGSGKTTLLRVLLGLLPRQGGEIIWNGRLIDDPGTFLVPPRVAYTPQVPRLFSETLRDNILLGQPEPDSALADALRMAVLERDVAAMPEGLETRVGPRGVRLSGGQVQRTAAARMFAREPALLVFDDLSSALDVTTEAELWLRLRHRLAERPESAVLAVSHRRAALERADRIVLLDDGRVADQGTLAELLDRSEEMRRLWSGQEASALDGAEATATR